MTVPFDAVAYKRTTKQQWDSAAKAWNDWGPFLRSWLGPSTELMLDLAKVGRGDRVLDVAAGAGDQTLMAAERVGAKGYVLAIDISPGILEFAAENARREGFSNIEVKALDGEALDVPESSFDAVISRVGLIYFPDRMKALHDMMRALRPGGRVAAIVYSTPENNKFFSTPVSIIRRRANLPPPAPGQPGPFSLAGPGVLEGVLKDAGFKEVNVVARSAPLHMASAAECVRFERESFGALHQMLSGLDQAGQDAAWAEIDEAMRAFERDGAFEGPCEMLVGVGVR